MDRKAFGISTTDENDDDEIAFHLERCEWMNGFLKDLWPYIAKYSDNLLRTDIQNTVRQMEPVKVFKNFEFTDVNLGFVPPRIEKIATYRRKCGKTKAVIMEAHINFCSNLNIGMKVMKFIKAGMKDLVFMGKCRIRFQPLIPEVPFFAAVSVSFDELPEINFDLTDLGNIVEVPGLNKIIKETVNSVFSDMFVRPNKFTVPMVPISIMEGIGIRPYDVMHPFPQGLLKVKLIRGEDLMAKDNRKGLKNFVILLVKYF